MTDQTSPNPDLLPAQHWEDQARDPADPDDDGDSALGCDDSTLGSTASLSESIFDYRKHYGRTFHAERDNAQYWGANDQRQSEAMDILHHTVTLFQEGKLYQAPLKREDVKKVLDVGCGTGIWAMDFADEFPDAEVIGTDISPIQATWVPPNLRFEIEDCTSPWTFQPDSFDYVHLRWMIGSIPDWTELFKQAYRALRPGGWLETFEPENNMRSENDTIKPTDAMGQWKQIFNEGGRKTGRPFDIYALGLQRKAMEEAGFVDIVEKDIRAPIGGWPKDPKLKEIGQWVHLLLDHDTEGYVLFITMTLGWTREQILVYIAQLRREMRSGKKKAYYMQKIVWGRKPLDAPTSA